MHRSTLDILCCPNCHGSLSLLDDDGADELEAGTLVCRGCGGRYPVKGGIPRFVPEENYAHNFGVQWNLFRQTQLDSHSGQPISRNRFLSFTGWTAKDLEGRLVLDAGCGAGRFAEVAVSLGARVVAVDFSNAVEAARENLKGRGHIDFVQADVTALPFAPGTFDFVYCLGVIQHTPSPALTFSRLTEAVAPDGRLAVDVYGDSWKTLFTAKYWIRPITKRLRAETSYRLVQRIFPFLYGVSRLAVRTPLMGKYLRYVIPVANYSGLYPLTSKQLREWALLDTFDMWSPAYDQPQSLETVRAWFETEKYSDIEVFDAGFFVGRGRKAARPG